MEKILKLLPKHIASAINRSGSIDDITEIRLRANKPVSLRINGKNYYITAAGRTFAPGCECEAASIDDINNTFFALCDNSVYSHENEIINGFISLKGGGRAGICGSVAGGTVRDITSINIRIPHAVKGVAKDAAELHGGLLVCGPPHSGKTTYLRDYLRIKSNSGENCCVIDCRGEIAAVVFGKPTLDVGVNTDIITFGKKADGIENALRSMNPDVIVFDEIGTREEVTMLSDCLNSGVSVATSLHCKNIEELLLRNKSLKILETGAFKYIVMLNKSYSSKIYEVGDVIGKDTGSGNNNNFLQLYGTDKVGRGYGEGNSA